MSTVNVFGKEIIGANGLSVGGKCSYHYNKLGHRIFTGSVNPSTVYSTVKGGSI